MKKLFVLMLSAGFLISASAFANVPVAKVPSRVTDALQARYANAMNVEWTLGLANYTASFNMGTVRYEAKFDRKGRWLESDKIMTVDQMPRTVRKSLRKTKYGRWPVASSYEQFKPNNLPSYHVLTANGVNKQMLVFDRSGFWVNG